MSKYIPYIVIFILIALFSTFAFFKLNSSSRDEVVTQQYNDVSKLEKPSAENEPKTVSTEDALPPSEVDLSNKSSIEKSIDNELNQLDAELKSLSDLDIEDDGLSDEQIGL